MNGSNVETLVNHIEIKLGGAALDPQIARDLHTVEAISTLGLPDMAEIQLTDEKN